MYNIYSKGDLMRDKNLCALTPPRGFNTWDCYGAAVNEEQLMANARFQADHLKEFGWEYVVCDIQWYEPMASSYYYHNFTELCFDEYSRLIPAPNRFPSSKNGVGFKKIADEIHALGLKFGIHILRGIPRQCVHLNTPTVTPGVTARDIASQFSVCPWNTDMYGVDAGKRGAQEYYDSLFSLYASWGVDFVKVDDISNTEFKPHDPYSARKEIEMIKKAIDNCGRDIVLSLSPGPAPLWEAEHLKTYANMWRMSGDFWDTSEALDRMFDLCYNWYPHTAPGCFPDCDMLPLGIIQLTEELPEYRARKTRFTEAEQYMVMNLWCIFRSPLMFGGEMTMMDDFTYSLITNKELLDINECSSENRPLLWDKKTAIWSCKDKNGKNVFAFFNLTDEKTDITLSAEDAGISAFGTLHDIWTKEKLTAEDALTVSFGSRGSRVLVTD